MTSKLVVYLLSEGGYIRKEYNLARQEIPEQKWDHWLCIAVGRNGVNEK